ncbi:glucose-1-phosphate thymidylyltransferase [Lewinella marina]|uniref:Glucose-1-phosphate thymidylyltransferase n=1 Tax=Neolewinella marina TaxID=438751 RepID=A0A2G0CG67_9BACT|nr:sugar phosphate nucleotidyltransferase [Neolewinella marina]NJB86574.1 glucose-1-phosphate thymidylyltransferase [Neolewinella marina]PHK98974.1 glucose-1-phosphate thymidylyltransferase [Neolewinella marina]
MKAIIPVAGAGMRLRPLTYTQPKPLIPVAGKPILSFIVDQLVELGVTDFIFIIGYLGEKIREYIERVYPQLDTVFVNQEERMGSAHAIWLARDHYVDADEIIIFFGDAIIDADLSEFVDSEVSCIGVKTVEDPRQFGVIEQDPEGNIRGLIEKPTIPRSNLAMVGCYKIREVQKFIEACAHNLEHKIRSIGEYPLTDALARMLEWGVELRTIRVDNWFDCGRREVLLQTNATFLDRPGFATDDPPPYDNSIIIHPVHIGKDCVISNSIVGPHVTVGANTKLENAIVSDSIIGDYARIHDIVLRKSVVGNDASIGGMRQSLNIGDNTEIDFGG